MQYLLSGCFDEKNWQALLHSERDAIMSPVARASLPAE